MKENKILTTTIIIMIIIAILTFFSGNIKFFMFDTSVESACFDVVANSKSDVNGQLLWFTYSADGDIELNTNMLIDAKDINVYALNKDGSITDEQCQEFETNNKQNGCFIAYTPKITMDYDSDGTEEDVYAYAKTDTIATQGFAPVVTIFSDSKIPFEVQLQERHKLVAFYNQEVLSNETLVMNSVDGEHIKVKTDKDGVIKGISLKEIRAGLNLTYVAPDNSYYVMSYQVEDNTLFGTRYTQALKPFGRIVLISCILIIVLWAVRNRKGILVGFRAFKINDTWVTLWDVICGVGDRIRGFKLDFMGIRWIIMILSFTLLTYGSHILGGWLSHVYLPIFACPQNQDQAVSSACYSLSHWDYLFGEHSVVEIIIFFVCFIVSVILLGRVVCGFICPFGMLQDIVYEIRQTFRLRGISFNEKMYGVMKLIKWEILILFLGAWAIGIDFCNFCPAIVMSPAFAGFKLSVYVSGFVAIAVIVLSFFKRRLWCNVCPVGYLVGLFQKFSLFRLKKNCQSCTECGACYEACPMGIKSIYTEREKEDITTADCIMCGECVKKCPENDAIAIAFRDKKIYTASRFKFFNK